VQLIELLEFFVSGKIATARLFHTGTDGGSLLIGQLVHAATARLDFAGNLSKFLLILYWPGLNSFKQLPCSRAHGSHSTFTGAGCSGEALAIRAALAMPASAATFFCGSEPGCTTPADMIRVAASSALMSTSMILLLGT